MGVWRCSAIPLQDAEHAKSLSNGGEYLSHVWLLWAFWPEPPEEEEITAVATGFTIPSFYPSLR
jgi:hypothetical protein